MLFLLTGLPNFNLFSDLILPFDIFLILIFFGLILIDNLNSSRRVIRSQYPASPAKEALLFMANATSLRVVRMGFNSDPATRLIALLKRYCFVASHHLIPSLAKVRYRFD